MNEKNSNTKPSEWGGWVLGFALVIAAYAITLLSGEVNLKEDGIYHLLILSPLAHPFLSLAFDAGLVILALVLQKISKLRASTLVERALWIVITWQLTAFVLFLLSLIYMASLFH